MAIQIISNQGIYLDGYDLQSVTNAIALKYSADAKDTTVLGQSTMTRIGGLKNVAASASGFVNAGTADLAMFSDVGLQDFPVTFGGDGDVYGSTSYFLNGDIGQLKEGAKVGDVLAYDLSVESSSNALVRGTIMLQSRLAALTTTGAGTSKQLGAVSATQKVYACIHIWQVGTGSITPIIESDSTNSFSGAQTTRISFNAASAVGGQFKSTAGAITDTWWRVKYTISGGAPSFLAVCSIGIQ